MSVAYAARNIAVRIGGKIHAGVDAYACCSRFVADHIIAGGYPRDRVKVLYNFSDLPPVSERSTQGTYAAYIGRISPEKGIEVVIEASRKSRVPLKIAGDPSKMPELVKRVKDAPVEFVGVLQRSQVPGFLANAKFLVVPSVWLEAFGIVCAEAMHHGLPVIASNIGGLPEVVEHDVTGLCMESGNVEAWAGAMSRLWSNDALCQSMGQAGRQRVAKEFSSDVFYGRLMSMYQSVVDASAALHKAGAA